MLRFRLQGPDPRGRAETLRGLVWHSWRSLGAKPGPTIVTRDHPPWNVLVIVLKNSGPHPQWKHRGTSQLWSCSSRGRKAGVGVRDRRQEAATVSTTKLWAGKKSLPVYSWEPEKPGSAESHTQGQYLWRDAQSTSDYDHLPKVLDTAVTPHRRQICLPGSSLSPAQLIKWALLSGYLYPLIICVERRHWRVTSKQRWVQNQNRVPVSKLEEKNLLQP